MPNFKYHQDNHHLHPEVGNHLIIMIATRKRKTHTHLLFLLIHIVRTFFFSQHGFEHQIAFINVKRIYKKQYRKS